MTSDLRERLVLELRKTATQFGLTASDLAVWLARPRATVRTWLRDGRAPRDDRVLTECARRIRLLRSCDKFPIPYEVTAQLRATYIREAFRNADDSRVPKRHSAR